MWLALDAGNSNVVVGLFAERADLKPLRTFRLSTHPIGTADELRARIRAVLADVPASLPEQVILSSVVPAFTQIARQAFPDLRVIDSTWPFSFRIATVNPAQTGIDRLVNAEAVCSEKGLPAIIVDSGTATTICAVTGTIGEAVFQGGAILPGIEACRDALPSRAAQLFATDLTPPRHAIGRGTHEALRSGVVLGYASMIDGMIERFHRELEALLPAGTRARVIATGGTSRLLREVCTRIDEFDRELTLKGMAYLFEKGSK